MMATKKVSLFQYVADHDFLKYEDIRYSSILLWHPKLDWYKPSRQPVIKIKDSYTPYRIEYLVQRTRARFNCAKWK